ncbi:MAG: metal-dependent hydrolase [Thermoplasmata archaeon]
MNRKTHIIFSLILTVLGLLLIEIVAENKIPGTELLESIFTSYNISDYFLMFLFSIVGALVPDILDPTYTRHHRGFAHSKMILLLLFVFFIITLIYLIDDFNLGIWSLYFFLLGYMSHLLLDSLTPAGLT